MSFPGAIKVGKTDDTLKNLHLKQAVINKYLFYFAFENSYQSGYVTEKIFDGLFAGIIFMFMVSEPFTYSNIFSTLILTCCI